MISMDRRNALAALSSVIIPTISGCAFPLTRGKNDKSRVEPDGCPPYPDAIENYCGSSNTGPSLGIADQLPGENGFIIRLETPMTVEIDPGSHGYFKNRRGEWSLITRSNFKKDRTVGLDSGQQYEWRVSYGDSVDAPNMSRKLISLKKLTPDYWNAISIPVVENNKLVSASAKFQGSDVVDE